MFSMLSGAAGENMTFGQTLLSIIVEFIIVVVLICGLICMKISGKKGESPAWTLCGVLGPIGIVICCFCDKISAAFKNSGSKNANAQEKTAPAQDVLTADDVSEPQVAPIAQEKKEQVPTAVEEKK